MGYDITGSARRAACAALLASSLVAVSAPAQAQIPVPVPVPVEVPVPVASASVMRQRYIWSTLGVRGALRAAAFGSYDQWRDAPSGWDQSANSLGKRMAASYTRTAISDGTRYAVAQSLHQDPGFVPCACRGVPRRLWHAVAGPFAARDRGGHTVASPAIISGILAGQLVAAGTWYPAPFSGRAVVRRVGFSVLTKAGTNLFREFRPRRRR